VGRLGSIPKLDSILRLRLLPRLVRIACAVVCFVTLNGVVCAQQQASGVANEKTVLRGTVVNSVTGQPIGRAVVVSSDSRFATMTNERGRFEMVFKEKKTEPSNGPVLNGSGASGFGTSTPNSGPTSFSNGNESFVAGVGAAGAGQVQQVTVDRPDFLTAKRIGFLSAKTSWGDAVAVARDQDEVTLSLTPEARVVGHVTLADGDGAAGIPVELYRQTVESGRAKWTNVGSAQARSDGEFRFADLEAGTYKLYSAELSDRDPVTSDPRGQGYGYPPDYFPGATDFAGGALIHIAAGETFQASLTPEKRRYYPVHIGVGDAPGGQLGVEVERDGHPGPGFTLGYDFRDGSIGGMLPDGNYLVKISTQSSNPLTGAVNLSVHGGPAAGMVTLLPGTEVEVRVRAELGDSTQADALRQQDESVSQRVIAPGIVRAKKYGASIQVQLVPVGEFNPGVAYTSRSSGDPLAEGSVVPGVPPGEYRVIVSTPVGYVASVGSGDTDLQMSNLVLGGGASVPPIEVTVRDDGAEIDGSIAEMAQRNAGNAPYVSGYVYVVPARADGEMKLVIPQLNGEFQVAQLQPGTYRVLAFDRPRNDIEFSNEDVMRKYDAPVVTVGAGQKTKVQVGLSRE
jgi:hypothetical protein